MESNARKVATFKLLRLVDSYVNSGDPMHCGFDAPFACLNSHGFRIRSHGLH